MMYVLLFLTNRTVCVSRRPVLQLQQQQQSEVTAAKTTVRLGDCLKDAQLSKHRTTVHEVCDVKTMQTVLVLNTKSVLVKVMGNYRH